jgi:hypothetical protein
MVLRSRPILLAALVVLSAATTLFWLVARTGPRPGRAPTLPPPAKSEEIQVESSSVEAPTPDTHRDPAAVGISGLPSATPDESPTPPAQASDPIQVTGVVTDSKGKSAAAQEEIVSLTSASGEHQSTGIEGGTYAFGGLEPGQYVLGCSIRGFDDAERRITLRTEEPLHREDFILSRAWMITVRILTPEGEDLRTRLQEEALAPLLQLSVLSTVGPPGDNLPPVFSLDRARDGVSRSITSWNPGEERDDRIQVLTDPPIYISIVVRDHILATQRVEDRVEEVTFTIELQRLRDLLAGFTARLMDGETGEPAANGWVTLFTSQSVENAAHTDTQGIVRYADCVPGLYEVHFHMIGRAPETRTVDLQPGRVSDLGTITLRKGVAIRGRCIDEEGHPRKVAATLLPIAEGASADGIRPNFSYAVNVDERGLFSITNVPAGRYLIQIPSPRASMPGKAELSWAAAPIPINTLDGPVENVVIVVRRPVAVILRPISSEVAGIRYDAMTTEGLSCCDGEFMGSGPERLDLAPGTYTLRLMRTHEIVRDIPFVVGSNPVTIDVLP